ncbi:class I adenylate-forming enzyme family protein [uncultured Tateyamaria sp.]|uniref:class I adenylate-forming enzyme family protein n=1 Tax=uncultured Tateyamaria sp. TaxID=455651 RepID=UPI002627FE85|nr:class I adenylate-forming enzyme family protein [uncultured Tateyamaria sp.]
MTLLHQRLDRAAAAGPRTPVIQYRDQVLTLSQLQTCARSLARWLSDAGVSQGDRVIVQAENEPMTAVLIYAISAIGGCFIPVHPTTPTKQFAYIKENSGGVMVLSAKAGEWSADVGGLHINVPNLNDLLHASTGKLPLSTFNPRIIPEDLACMIYTSGSTGRPKGVTCLHRQMVFAVGAIADALDYATGDVIFCSLPLSFDYGLYQLFLAVECGAMLRLESPEIGGLGLFRALKKSRANVLPAVPAMIEALAVMGKRKPGELPALRLVTNTGAAPSPTSIKTLRSAFPNLGFQLMYGLTECKRVSITPVDGDILKPGTCGRPLRGTRVEVVNASGTVLPPDEIGEFVISGPNVMAGYWNSEELTNKTYQTQHATMRRLHSGDYGWMDEDGYLYCQGRRDDIFKIRGFRVSCSEIEAACSEAPVVRHAVMVPPAPGRPSTLFICASDSEFDLLGFLDDRLEPHKIPDRIRLIDDMPRTANNKFDRRALINSLQAEMKLAPTQKQEMTHA